ncbi:MAG TPA: 4-alpha-glucanotransferase, partial [Enterovirga sp.]|nr:4-alpha-glucanotransferase [Enterovirga sp.]
MSASNETAPDEIVGRLATLVGIAPGYTDAFGNPVETPLATRRNILGHLGFPAETQEQAEESLARADALRNALVPKVISVSAGRPIEVPLRGTTAESVSWRLTDESGRVREDRVATRTAAGRSVLRLPALGAGYYGLELRADNKSATATLIAAPARCWQPGWMREGGRAWGLAAQIYAVRSDGNLGIGCYADIGEAAAGAGSLGASFLGLSPVHALFESDRTKISPYSPSSRLFLETIHIDPRAVEGFAGSAAERLLDDPERKARIAALREAPL